MKNRRGDDKKKRVTALRTLLTFIDGPVKEWLQVDQVFEIVLQTDRQVSLVCLIIAVL